VATLKRRKKTTSTPGRKAVKRNTKLKIRRRLVRLLGELGEPQPAWSVAKFAFEFNLNLSTVKRWFTPGSLLTVPDPIGLIQLAKGVNGKHIDINWLLTGKGKPFRRYKASKQV
jgi:hypothetical protein